MGDRGRKKPIYQKWWFWLIIVIIICGVIGAIVGSQYQAPAGTNQSSVSGQTSIKNEEATAVNAIDLIVAYEENQVAADNQYKNKKLKITGIVKNIGVDAANRAYVMLEDERNQYAILGVQCYFDKDNQDTLSELKEGDIVTITGTCEGKVVSVSVKNCELNLSE